MPTKGSAKAASRKSPGASPQAGNPTTLVVVESPAKARSIQKMLGPGYEVRASLGHVADLPERELGVDVERDFAPTYEVKKDKKPVVEDLKRAARGKRLLLATDPDREGEAIGWHVARLLGRDPKEPLRVEFHEITPKVVRQAVENPRPIDQNLVDAQQARRVLDRLVGYNLSPLLSLEFRKRALSAGRVQSVALRLLVEREEEIDAFRPEEYWTLEGVFALGPDITLSASLYEVDALPEGQTDLRKQGGKRLWAGQGEKEGKLHLANEAQALALAGQAKEWSYRVAQVETKERRKSPPPPFTTSTLQQAASTRLGYTASRTMRIAQRLYEGVDLPEGTVGLITYMRTDSVRVSPEALQVAREVVQKLFGSEYLPEAPRVYRNRKEGVQDAHEAIRPTDARRTPDSVRKYLSDEEYRLYDLIWRRFIASQMRDALYEQTVVFLKVAPSGLTKVAPSGLSKDEGEKPRFTFRASGSVLKFEGYLKAWGRGDEGGMAQAVNEGQEAEVEPPLPPVAEGTGAELLEVKAQQHFTEPPPRYTDATLVKTLEELGIGRPSTYAPTLETLEKRGYMVRKGRTLLPTPLGRQVTHYLKERFPQVVAYEFTARMEDRLDQVEEGKVPWPKVVWEFYEPFLGELARVPKKTCPRCGRPLELKVSRYGQFLGCTGYPECTYTEPLEKKEAEPIGEACPKCGRPLVRKEGRYGSFIACSGYPECDYTRDDGEPTGHTCPKCGSQVLKKQSRRGKPYYKCENNACDFLSFYPLLDQTCPSCGWPLVKKGEGACMNPACPVHDPKLVPPPKASSRVASPSGDSASKGRRSALTSRRKAATAGGSRTGANAKARVQEASPPKPPKDWEELRPFLGELTPEERQAAEALVLGEPLSPEAAKLAQRAIFKLRMKKGRARKEAVT
ncbi:type I DNA topoisomerase [Thermus tenuipuniceus]|uniref:type I DNA topoisomerase n=1 Tax=Thermus tenuipuniceus TaxID=2078690 RepID=UPI00244D4D0C|nr:type I DNA topoisomerase [Thermus tenuipuniceus]